MTPTAPATDTIRIAIAKMPSEDHPALTVPVASVPLNVPSAHVPFVASHEAFISIAKESERNLVRGRVHGWKATAVKGQEATGVKGLKGRVGWLLRYLRLLRNGDLYWVPE